MQKIGVLLPRSTYYKTIGFDIYEGLKSGLKQAGREDIKIITENIGFGADKQQCYRSAEKLLLEEEVSLVLAFIGHRTAELLRPLFLAANKMLIVLDAGANLPNEWPTCPNIFYHSLHNSLGAWLTARKASQDGYQEGAMITGYYDGGYLHTYSISKSFENAGSKICFNHATGYQETDFTMEPIQNQLATNANTAFLSLFSGDFVQWYFKEINNRYRNQNLPIYLTPFGLEETVLEAAVLPSDAVSGVISWSKKIENNENKIFIETIESSGKKPNLFSLISWEASSIAIKTLDLLAEQKHVISKVASELHEFEFESPRGKIYFDKKTNTSITNLYEATLIENKGTCEIKLGKEIKDTKEEFEKLCNLPLHEVTSAWYNSYTCI
ncbi:ABC transporter substrate-binding protein [Flavobacterium sp. NRK F10]|uniref:ABC transporter substrate-binding protein n=1 Tax=Flavobacterium sediminis TaxID=2201181 RepID=A0A2U8QRL5_9FLAO|nr:MULTISPECIES: ABC transporter substrate-binding protein [Flavobacterium]AWM12800.1 ABC transporter substrate-binding protein [Flavobacterium sediminis]MCO6173926.1 ABC transporter substrate-binding protein [Flavobacterium sp. NRK F10]